MCVLSTVATDVLVLMYETISMNKYKEHVTKLRKQRSYVFLARTHRSVSTVVTKCALYWNSFIHKYNSFREKHQEIILKKTELFKE